MNNKLFWHIIMANVILGWIFVLFGVFLPYNGVLKAIWFFLITGMGIVHPLQLFISIPIGKKTGFSAEKTVLGTLIFGFSWWIPVKLKVFTSISN